MNYFYMNGIKWSIIFVDANDPMLVDRTNALRVATTDVSTSSVYISNRLSGNFKTRVLIHELGHCALVSFNLLADIHSFVPRSHWIEAEEWVCNFIADYGLLIFSIAYDTFGDEAWRCIPQMLDRWIA